MGSPPLLPAQETSARSLWTPIRRVFGRRGQTQGRYLLITLPRSDLRVRIGNDALSPHFEFTSYVGFMPIGAHRVKAMGEVVLCDDEGAVVLLEAHRQKVQIGAVHNHLIGATPRIV